MFHDHSKPMLILVGLVVIIMVILFAIELKRGNSVIDVLFGPSDKPIERQSLFEHLSVKTDEKLADIGVLNDNTPMKSILKTDSHDTNKKKKNVTFGVNEILEFNKDDPPEIIAKH